MVSVPRPRAAGLRGRLVRLAVRFVRRYGLLPAGMPDRRGDDDRLAGTSLDQTVMVYFPDTRQSLYQLRQWYRPLRALDALHRVVVVCQDSRSAAAVREESGLPALTIAHYRRLDDLLSRSEVKLALYVNHSPQNFSALRFTSLAHVYLSHGESDKGVMVSNQCKAYDFWFVAGRAAIERISSRVMFYDAEARCIPVGRPQLDEPVVTGPAAAPGARPTVLYAPTWEGAQPSLAYGSLPTHGVPLVRALLADGRWAVAYRPHPLTGVSIPAHGDADAEVRRLVTEAAAADPTAGHRVDVDRELTEVLADADLLVCDVSAVAMDWLPSGRPLVVTEPADPGVVTAGTRLLDVVPRLPSDVAADAERLLALVDRELREDPTRTRRLALVEHYLGDTSPGAATARFVDACTEVIARRDAEWARVVAHGPAGP